jgi:hypothetical protein
MKAGSNTSTVALRVVGGETKREPSSWGYNWATLFLVDINTGTDPPGWGSLESETVKYGHESRWTRTQDWLLWREPPASVNGRPYSFGRESAPYNKPATV